MKYPTDEEQIKRLGDRTLNEFMVDGKSLIEWVQLIKEYKEAEEQGLLINLSKQYTAEEVKDIFHTLMESCYGVPIPKETTDRVVDDLMR